MSRIVALGMPLVLAAAVAPAEDAKQVLATAGVRGGLVVCVGCADAKGTVALGGEGFVVQGLDTDAARVAAVRRLAKERNRAGRVTADTFDGEHLPYTDNLVSLLVVEEAGRLAKAEMLRALAPGGVALLRKADKWEKLAKPRPAEIDEWTHYLHDPGNNAVARDTAVGPPRHTQWLAGPRWTRNHHKLNSISSVVTAAGRLFAIVDEATAANATLPGKWAVVARDAFSGVTLWRRSLKQWAAHTHRFRSGPPQVTRLLVASPGRVYLPLGLNEPVSALDAATGELVRTYQATAGAEEIILAGGTLLVLKGAPVAEHAVGHAAFRGEYKLPNRKTVVAINADDGRKLWEWSSPDANPRPETLGSDGRSALFQIGEAVMCLDLASGKERWTYGTLPKKAPAKTPKSAKAAKNAKTGKRAKPRRRSSGVSYGRYVLVVADGVVLSQLGGKLTAIDAKAGKKLWECKGGHGFHAPEDVFVIDGIVWYGIHPSDSVAPPPVGDFSQGRDLRTGEIKHVNRVMVDLQTAGHHHRCYREKATVRYILTGKRGVEMMDLLGENHSRNNWVRGTCQYGVLPANGLLYAPPHSCGCYPESLLWGFWALAAARPVTAQRALPLTDPGRLEKGPAYAELADAKSQVSNAASNAWPQYRCNALRNGVAGAPVPAELKPEWKARLGGKLTQPVVAGGKVLLAAVNAGTVYALDEKTGQIAWQRTVGGRVDSPPSIHNGRVLFGSADGRVYCLRLADGELAWRFFAAPADVKTVALDQVESVWPVHGSVLMLNGIAYFAAGRSTWLDGGIALYGLDPATGKVVHSSRFASRHPTVDEGKGKGKPEHNAKIAQNVTDYRTYLASDRSDSFSMAAGAVTDVLVSDGQNVFLHHTTLNARLQKQDTWRRHLFSTAGLLDEAENHRSHWVLGTGDFSKVPVAYSWVVNRRGRWGPGVAVPTGVMMAFTERAVWVAQRKGDANGKYQLLRKANTPFSQDEKSLPDFRKVSADQAGKPAWLVDLPVRPRAMLKAGENLILGCMPIEGLPDDPHAAYEGRRGGMIRIVSAADGKDLAEYKLDAPVVWDGLAAAGGRLFVTTAGGEIQCWARQ